MRMMVRMNSWGLASGAWLLALLVVPVGFAEMRIAGPEDGQNAQDVPVAGAVVNPAAGPSEPSLLDVRVEELKNGSGKVDAANADDDEEETIPAAAKDPVRKPASAMNGQAISASGLRVLNNDDADAYKAAFTRARRGEAPNLKADDKVLAGEVQGLYLLNRDKSSFSELNGWLKDYRDLPMAADIYDKAQSQREHPRQVCKTQTVTEKVTKKGKGKHAKPHTVTQKSKKKVCTMVGEWGPAPIVPMAVERREAMRNAREASREDELGKLSAEGRRIMGQSWRLRGQGKYGEAMNVLLAPNARVESGTDNWQSELVKIADYYHGQRDWKNVLRAAEPASDVKGPHRDDARWLAGYAHYLQGDVEAAAGQWEQLVQKEPMTSPHFSRAAWWGARALTELKQGDRAKSLLQAGAKDSTSFYGQLCAAKLGKTVALDWSAPKVDSDDFNQLQSVKAARRGLALAQIGEVSMAQRQLRVANEDLPYNATRALGAVSVRLGLPATALYAAKQMKEQGEIMPAALFPLAEDWNPDGGWSFDRALMLGIMRQESAFQPQIGSRVGAQGLMQLMPATAAFTARLSGRPLPARGDLHDPGINLALSQTYLKYLSGKLDGNLMLVVAAYNGGIGNVQRWLNRGVTPGHDPVLWLESIPFDETRDYVEKVFANYWLYQQRMNKTAWSLNALADGYWPLQWSGNARTASINTMSPSAGQ